MDGTDVAIILRSTLLYLFFRLNTIIWNVGSFTAVPSGTGSGESQREVMVTSPSAVFGWLPTSYFRVTYSTQVEVIFIQLFRSVPSLVPSVVANSIPPGVFFLSRTFSCLRSFRCRSSSLSLHSRGLELYFRRFTRWILMLSCFHSWDWHPVRIHLFQSVHFSSIDADGSRWWKLPTIAIPRHGVELETSRRHTLIVSGGRKHTAQIERMLLYWSSVYTKPKIMVSVAPRCSNQRIFISPSSIAQIVTTHTASAEFHNPAAQPGTRESKFAKLKMPKQSLSSW